MYEYMTLPAATKLYGAKEFPSPTKVWATLNKREKAYFDWAMKNKTSALYKGVVAGRRAHKTLEDDVAANEFQSALLEMYNNEIATDINETWAKEKGVVSQTHKYKGMFDGVGIYRDRETIWDYKKSNKVKTPSGAKKHLKQCAAYAIAHNEMYGSNIDQIAIFNIAGSTIDELSTRVFVYDLNSEIKQEWLNDVDAYWNEVRND
tara:strand:+ start:99 stop:713 length:615 start_codon:yes stop_codon:yes gene_type:complete